VKPRKHKNYKSDVATVLFHSLSFRRGRFRLGKRGPPDQNLPRVSMPRVNKFPPSSKLFFQISHISGPSDQSSVNVDRPIRSSKVRPTRRNFPGCCGSSASDTVWSSKSQSEQSCGLERQMKKKALSRNKKPGFHT
jgi:hypothetical protein